jgi:hypothetical protein
MATQVEAARLLTLRAARMKDAGRALGPRGGHGQALRLGGRAFCVEESFRIHGGYGYSKEYEIERLYRDAPLLLIGEGTSRDPAHGHRQEAPAAPQDLSRWRAAGSAARTSVRGPAACRRTAAVRHPRDRWGDALVRTLVAPEVTQLAVAFVGLGELGV